jgi:hypothetical protein
MLWVSAQSPPALGRMFMAHLHRWALAFLGSGFGGSSQRGGIGTASAGSLPNGIASL